MNYTIAAAAERSFRRVIVTKSYQIYVARKIIATSCASNFSRILWELWGRRCMRIRLLLFANLLDERRNRNTLDQRL